MGFKDFGRKLFPDNFDEQEYEPEDFETENTAAEERQSNVRQSADSYASARTSAGNMSMSSGSSIEMKVVTPSRFDSVTQIADLLLDKKTVLLNLEGTNKETAKRLIDFLSGVAYALSGDVQKVADNTYAITPSNVAVSKEPVGPAQPAAAETSDSENVY